ncbi:hypothetical protein XH91_01680 [Bradyrhizobium guangzhouense]|uniref:Uncharacterized protein n=2 Tax=Bradyrhizobium guangzhouense TaxID=1325095 RepID=A0AAE5WW41_9BRAD|nr:hypothetical protein XH91_01680 [Bradyrhizobium guangzhouense]
MLVLVGISFVTFGSIIGLVGAFQMDAKKPSPPPDLSKNEGVLVPAEQQMPPLPPHCDLPQGAVAVFLGTDVAWATRFPYVALQAAKDEMLTIEKDPASGEISIATLRIYGADNKVIASIRDGEFWVSGAVRKKRPDASTLIVYDEKDAEVLRVVYLNRRAIVVTGIFRHPDISPRTYVVTREGTKILPGQGEVGGNCLGNGSFLLDRNAFGIGIVQPRKG